MKVCIKCGKEFTPTSNRQKWCRDCGPYYVGTKKKKRKDKFCIVCGADISYKMRDAKRCDECKKEKIKYKYRVMRRKRYYVGSIVGLDPEIKKDIMAVMELMTKINDEIK